MGKGAAKGAVQGAADGLISGMVSGAVAGAMNPSFCFVAGTTVLTTLGKKAIETIQVGDAVPCVDHITGEATEKKVVSTSVNKVNRLIELEINGDIIQCTETHPFQVKGKGWIDACELHPGDIVYTKDWNTATVNSVSLLELEEPVDVFNFEVEDCHTYFVSERCILVHNASCHLSKEWRAERKRYWKGEAEAYKGNVNRQWSDSGTYKVTKNNMQRMMQGKAPIGKDGFSVQLHHYHDGGIATDMYAYAEITRFEHFTNFKALHPWLFR